MGIFSYTPQRPGKGVDKGGPRLRRPFLLIALFFENIWNFIKINFMFLLTCLPVVTIGPSLCSLTYFSKCVTTDTHMFIGAEYFEYFKKNFFKGLFASIINLIPLSSLGIILMNLNTVPHFNTLLLPVILVNVIVIIMSFYVYPMIITYDIPLWAIYKNAFIFTMIKLPLNIVVLFSFLVVIALACLIHIGLGNLIMPFMGYGPALIISLIIPCSVIASLLNFVTTFSVFPTIKKYMEE